MTNNGGPAFPQPEMAFGAVGPGLSARDYFAAAALTGMLANPYGVERVVKQCAENNSTPGEVIVKAAFKYADQMLKERDKR